MGKSNWLFLFTLCGLVSGLPILPSFGNDLNSRVSPSRFLSVNDGPLQEPPIPEPSLKPSFWQETKDLIQQQLYLLYGLRRAIASADRNDVEANRGLLIVHLIKLDRFIYEYFPSPELLCDNRSTFPQNLPQNPPQLNTSQQDIYCTLYRSFAVLDSMLEILNHRVFKLTELSDANTGLNRNLDNPLRYDFRRPTRSRIRPEGNYPPPQPTVLRGLQKRPLENAQPSQPAIDFPLESAATLDLLREKLLRLQPQFPSQTPFIDPEETKTALDRLDYIPFEEEIEYYTEFLSQPYTGIARIFPPSSHQTSPNQLENRLDFKPNTYIPLTPFVESSFVPYLALNADNEEFFIPAEFMTYGFLKDVGEVPFFRLEALERLPQLSPIERSYFLAYRPPQKLAELKQHQHQFFFNKLGQKNAPHLKPPLAARAPIQLQHTYIMRLIQYQLPQSIVTGEPINRSDRRYTGVLLETPSSDLLVAFRPVYQRSDKSYTIIWMLLGQFEEPQILDLGNYVNFQ